MIDGFPRYMTFDRSSLQLPGADLKSLIERLARDRQRQIAHKSSRYGLMRYEQGSLIMAQLGSFELNS